MFGGPAGLSSYNSATGKFDEVSSNNWQPYDYGSVEALKQQADLTIAGAVQDCGECHVGGGAMEYVPYSDMDARVSLRDIDTADVNGAGPIDTEVTTFNYLIDIYDLDGDGDQGEVLAVDWDDTGVMEKDCFLCHLEGYNYEARVEMLREFRIDASRTVAAGLGEKDDTLSWGDAGYGTTVSYYSAGDDAPIVVDEITGQLKLAPAFAERIKGTPPSENCASCHFGNGFGVGEEGEHQVDWKKRGDHWFGDKTWDVHVFLADASDPDVAGCMLCHRRTPGSPVGTSGAAGGSAADKGHLGLCDPAKGDAPFSSMWNAKDSAGMYTCEGCHDPSSPLYNPLAPDPTAAHMARGLTELICQDGTDGIADASHIDIIDCSACHVRKLKHFSGGAMVDATGSDPEGRLADHENDYVQRDVYDNLTLSWYKGKLIKTSSLLTMFWRDKNDINFDANGDGRGGGMDALLMTHVNNINDANGWSSITHDLGGTVTQADISDRQSAIAAAIKSELGSSSTGLERIRLSFMGVLFKVNHNVSPKYEAWGANGCADCHSPGAGFYNGEYEVKGRDLNISYAANSSQRVPFTKANSMTQPTDYHPNIKNKLGNRSVAVQVAAGGSIRNPDRSEFIYESTFMAPNTEWYTTITGSAITFPDRSAEAANAKGWYVKIDVDSDGDDSPDATYTLQNPWPSGSGANQVDSVADLIAAWDSTNRCAGALATGSYGFTVSDGGGYLVFTATGSNRIRINPASGHAGPLGLASYLYVPAPITSAIDGTTTFSGRSDWVAYLDGIGVAGTANITAPADGDSLGVGTAVTFTADTTGHGVGTTYRWQLGDGTIIEGTDASIVYTYNTPGTYTVRLYVFSPSGDSWTTDSITVDVGQPPPQSSVSYDAVTEILSVTNMPIPNSRVYVVWGDGTKSSVDTTNDTEVSIEHTYKRYDMFFDGTNYNYKTHVRIFNGGTLMETVELDVSLAP